MTRSSRPPPTLEELRRRRAQLTGVLSKTSESEERALLEQELDELDDTIVETERNQPAGRQAG